MVTGVYSIPLPCPAPGHPCGATSPEAPRLARFLIGPENRLARVAAESFLLPPTAFGAYNPLVICGATGCGKTHLVSGLSVAWCQQYRRNHVVFTRADGLRRSELRPLFSDSADIPGLLVVENLERIDRDASRQRELQLAIDQLMDTGGKVVVTSRTLPAALPNLTPRLRSRLSAGLLVSLSAPSYESRLDLLAAHAQSCCVEFIEDAAATLALRLESSAGQLGKAVAHLAAMTSPAADHRVIDKTLVLQYLGQEQSTRQQSIARVVSLVARRYGFKPTDLKGRSRRRAVATARCVAMFLAWKIVGHSLQRIGKYLGGRDHTTVMHGCHKIQSLLQTDPAIQQAVQELKPKLTNPETP